MTSNKYDVRLSIQSRRDTKEAIFYKKELGTRDDNLEKFKRNLAQAVQRLETSPKIGTSLAARIPTETAVRYLPVDDYLLFYEIHEKKQEVHVIRILPGKTNWVSKIIKSTD